MDSRRDFTSKKVFSGYFSELGEKANSALATYITTNKARTTAASAFACVDCPKICCAVKPCGKP